MAKVYTLGVEPNELEFVQKYFAGQDGKIVDVTDRYTDILAMVCDIAIIVKEKASKEALEAIASFRDEVGEDDDTVYYIVSQKEWDEIILLWKCNLLEDVSKNKRHLSTDKKYNIFYVLEVADKEVIMCRFLYDLLDSSGAHGNGTYYLESFLKNVLKISITEEEIRSLQTYKEYLIGEDRRIDLVIANQKIFIPIEVKINAEDQGQQCYDYYNYAKKHCLKSDDVSIVYLTKNGKQPSDYSIYSRDKKDRVPAEKIKTLSFRDDIRNWLISCIRGDESAIDMIMRQYIAILGEMKTSAFEEMKNMVSDIIIKDANTLRASIMVSDSIKTAKAKLMYQLFLDLEKGMVPLIKKYGLKKEERANWYSYENQATESYYDHNYSTYPGLNYVVDRPGLSGEKSLWLRIEVDYNIFAGFCAFDYSLKSEEGEGNQLDKMDQKSLAEYEALLNIPVEQDAWWLYWVYLPTGENKNSKLDQVPNFKEMNEAAVALADAEARKQFVQKCIEAIEENLLKKIR